VLYKPSPTDIEPAAAHSDPNGFAKPRQTLGLIITKSLSKLLCPRRRLFNRGIDRVRMEFKLSPVIVPEEGIFHHPSGALTMLLKHRSYALSRLGDVRQGRDFSRYCNFAYSALASCRMGISRSASFHNARKSW
jgi:hypothetical protein